MNKDVTQVDTAGKPIKVLIDGNEYTISYENEDMFITNEFGKFKIDIQENGIAKCQIEMSDYAKQLSEQQRIDAETPKSVGEVDAMVVAKIREKYDINSEFEMINLGIIDKSNTDFKSYRTYVEECKAWGKQKKQELSLI
jgi:hypothetical protein